MLVLEQTKNWKEVNEIAYLGVKLEKMGEWKRHKECKSKGYRNTEIK
jgi:hypothetical protein